MSGMAEAAFDSVKATLERAGELENALAPGSVEGEVLAVPTRQRKELWTYIEAHTTHLRKTLEEAGGTHEIISQRLLPGQVKLEKAIQFIQASFVRPRESPTYRRELECADWLCIDGFREKVDSHRKGKDPVGPIVVVDSSLSPAVWSENAKLPLPSLFQESSIRRGDGDDGNLGRFPVICFPASAVHDPLNYLLLSHEVGHAIDTANTVTRTIDVSGLEYAVYWRKWARELFADAAGLVLSGELFPYALSRYIHWLNIEENNLKTYPYPGRVLRLHLALNLLEVSTEIRDKTLAGLRSTTDEEKKMIEEFRSSIGPKLLGALNCKPEAWQVEQGVVCSQADMEPNEMAWEDMSYRFLPSIAAWRSFKSGRQAGRDLLQVLHEHAGEGRVPGGDWVVDADLLDFTIDIAPNLRPTILDENRQIKVPPDRFFEAHEKLAFIGSVNNSLPGLLKKAFENRKGRPWKSIEIYFGNDDVLGRVYREKALDGDAKSAPESLAAFIAQRDAAIEGCRERFAEGVAESFSMGLYDGPCVFGSYWDWEEEGGRIHIGPQFMGTDIKSCPSIDILCDGVEGEHESFVRHLQSVGDRSESLT